MAKPEAAIWWSVFVVAIVVGLIGDVAMKRAGIGESPAWRWFCLGYLCYSATSFGWFFLLRGRDLSMFGTLYPVANAMGLVVLGAVIFHEKLDHRAWAGIGLGIISMLLLNR
jgi:drug/metabolite transporter (DMT)-like permease